MAKQTPNATIRVKKKLPKEPIKIAYLFLLIAYGFVTVLTPNLLAMDANGPKFLTLSLLNLATYLFLFTRKELKTRPEGYYAFFRNGIGIAYVGLMIVSLLSFFKAINVLESVLHFAKIFTTFSAAYLVSILVMADKRNIRYLCIAMTLLLIFDSITVFKEINNYIHGKLGSISEIKSIYSNKNILTSSVFVKIPFALWLMVFFPRWLRALGILGTFLAITAILFMSSRAFYLGIFALTVVLILYFSIRFIQSRDKYQLKLAGIYLVLVIFSFLIFSTTQRYLYPQIASNSLSVGARLATITDPGGGNRLEGWKRSWHVFKEDPILGVGLGNWKIATLKEENLTSQDNLYNYKAHNDFIEITTETGIFGGLFFITLFLLTGWAFVQIFLKNSTSEWLTYLFLPTFGLLCYSVDAFFNFPQDRPEIQALFALYLGMAVVVTYLYTSESIRLSQNSTMGQASILQRFRTLLPISSLFNSPEKSGNNFYRLPTIIVFGVVLTVSSYILYLNFNSLKLQRIIAVDIIKHNKPTIPASIFINGFPVIPNLNFMSEPIATQKARYLVNEHRNDEAIVLLKKDESNPFFALKESLIAEAYNDLKNIDSSLVYYQKAYKIKPNYFLTISNLCLILQHKGLQKEGETIIEKYLNKTKTNKEAWLFATSYYEDSGNIQKAASAIDSASHYFPADSLVLKQKAAIGRKALFVPYQALYDAAIGAFNAKKYDEAAQYFSQMLNKEPNFPEARNFRAFCYFNTKEYTKSKMDLDLMISSGETRSNMYNLYSLRGSNYYYLGNKDEACKNYKIAAEMGDKDGLDNYAKICQAVKK